MSYKIIFSDMDGTLLHHVNDLSLENKKAIQSAQDKGVLFMIATGRPIYGLKPFLEQLNLIGSNSFVICQNGATIYNLKDMSLCEKNGFTPTEFAPIFELAQQSQVHSFFFDHDAFMVQTLSKDSDEYERMSDVETTILPDPLSYNGSFTKVLLEANHDILIPIQTKIRESYSHLFDCFFSNKNYLEIVKKDVNKGSSIEHICQKLNVDLKDVIAVGDSENDLSMILKAGLGVSVANGATLLKDASDVILEKTNNEHAIAELIEKFI